MTEAIITLDHVVREFRAKNGSATKRAAIRAVNDVSLTINRGDVFGIIGYSGAGKSTLVRMINALERPTSGRVTVLDKDITGMSESALRPIRQSIGMIFQQFNLFSTKTVAQNVAYPLQLDHWRKDYQQRRVKELLDFVGLRDHARSYPSQLSGGQKQRVGIARALATNPKILLADEATSALDPETTAEVLSLLKRVNERFGITIVLITHQMSVVQQIANRIAVMSAGRVVEQGEAYDVFAAPQAAVTRRFIATALSGVPDERRVAQLHAQWPGPMFTVLIRQRAVSSGADRPAVAASGQNISELISRYDIHSNLLWGGIDTVGGSAIGAMTYELDAGQPDTDAFLRELHAHSDVVEFGTAERPVDYRRAMADIGIFDGADDEPGTGNDEAGRTFDDKTDGETGDKTDEVVGRETADSARSKPDAMDSATTQGRDAR